MNSGLKAECMPDMAYFVAQTSNSSMSARSTVQGNEILHAREARSMGGRKLLVQALQKISVGVQRIAT